MLGVPHCFDDQTPEAAPVMGNLIAEADAASSGATTETAANAAVHPLSTEARCIASWDLYPQRLPPLHRRSSSSCPRSSCAGWNRLHDFIQTERVWLHVYSKAVEMPFLQDIKWGCLVV